MKRLGAVVLAGAIVMGWTSSIWGQQKTGWFLLDLLDCDRSTGKLRVEGRANLPDETVVHAQVHYKGPTAVSMVGIVKKETILLHFQPLQGKILAGNYLIRLQVRREDQSSNVLGQLRELWPTLTVVDVPLKVGDEAEQKSDEKMVRDKLLAAMNSFREAYTHLDERGNYMTVQLQREKMKAQGGEIPAEVRQPLLRSWDRFCREYWDGYYHRGMTEFQDYHDNAFAPLFPEAEENVKGLIVALGQLRASYWSDMALLTGADVPQYARAGEVVPRNDLLRMIREKAASFYRLSRLEGEEWKVVVPGELERGAIQGNVYRSENALFQIEKPEGWIFESVSYHPGLRLRMRPPDVSSAWRVFADVEIRNFPDAEKNEDLVEFLEITSRDRWPAFRKIAGRHLSVNDPLVKGGIRKGYEIDFFTELEGNKMNVEDYDLFCQTGKRTFGVLCIVSLDRADQYRKEFDSIKRSLKVLDPAATEAPPVGEKKGKAEEK